MTGRIVGISLAVLLPASLWAQGAAAPYPTMAPVDQYRMDRAAEISLARSAAPASISGDADVLVLGTSGYETAAKGKNGFVCVVERGWANDFGRSDFWNPKVRSPFCYNPAAALSVLPDYLNRTKLALSGMTEAKIQAASASRTPAVGAMIYMLSKDGYLGDDVKGPWHPHVMFVFRHTPDSAWGANADHSPLMENDAPNSPLTVLVIPVGHWSDGSADSGS